MNMETLDMEYSILDDGTIEITKYNGKGGNVVIPSSIEGKKVTNIGKNAFVVCNKLTSITIPDSATSIGRAAFYDCLNLISITIPNSVTSIGNNAFSLCSRLINVTISNSVTSLGDEAFEGCVNLKKYNNSKQRYKHW